MAWASRAMIIHYEDGLQPKWLAAEGFVTWGRAYAHILMAQVIAEKSAEWAE